MWIQLDSTGQGCFVAPQFANIFNRITPSTRNNHWNIKFHHIFNTCTMPFHRNIKSAEPVPSQRVCPALHKNAVGFVPLHYFIHYGPENKLIRIVVNSFF
eukprot:NODE_109_length_18665_cov_0.924486.p23 type:complete len:100 gc:universal NODE_109_length_18665_cov_0.924486:2006-1707(-)